LEAAADENDSNLDKSVFLDFWYLC
jgi:hypothetical protein